MYWKTIKHINGLYLPGKLSIVPWLVALVISCAVMWCLLPYLLVNWDSSTILHHDNQATLHLAANLIFHENQAHWDRFSFHLRASSSKIISTIFVSEPSISWLAYSLNQWVRSSIISLQSSQVFIILTLKLRESNEGYCRYVVIRIRRLFHFSHVDNGRDLKLSLIVC